MLYTVTLKNSKPEKETSYQINVLRQQGSQCTYNVILWGVRTKTVAVEKQ